MKGISLLTVVTLFSISLFAYNASAGVKVSYGKDNRVDVKDFWDLTALKFDRSMYTSVAGMVDFNSIEFPFGYSGTHIKIPGQTLGEAWGLCKGEKFANQLTVSSCTGFLIDDDILVTAGHCIEDQADCETKAWIFDYRVENTWKGALWLPSENVFTCKRLLKRRLSDHDMNDYALIQLDRSTRRKPLKFRRYGKVMPNAPLVVIGHPSGLPAKIAPRAEVRENDNKVYFTTNLDTFGGNSGSPVFNIKTGLVEGILVRGETDYIPDHGKRCYKVNRCKNDECRGEDVTRITNILEHF
ncbi:MAG: trypsin-like serine peptidase [Bacteriovoracia bacterium]